MSIWENMTNKELRECVDAGRIDAGRIDAGRIDAGILEHLGISYDFRDDEDDED